MPAQNGWFVALFAVLAVALGATLAICRRPKAAACALAACLGVICTIICTPVWDDDVWTTLKSPQIQGEVYEVGSSGNYTTVTLRGVTVDSDAIEGYVRLMDSSRGHYLLGQTLRAYSDLLPNETEAYLGAYNSQRYGLSEGIRFTAFVEGAQVMAGPPPSLLQGVATALRVHVQQNIFKYLPLKTASITYALLTGDRSFIDPKLYEALRRVGVLHLLVVSGLHISLSAGGVFMLALKLKCPPWLSVLLSALVIFFYTLLTGWTYAITRAVIMWGVWLVGPMTSRRYDAPSSLALAFIIVLLVNPLCVYSVGFQLSFAATFGIVFLLPALDLEPTRFKVLNGVLAALAVSFCASLATLPVMATFGELFPLTPFANLVATPLATLLLITGALISFFAWLAPLIQGIGVMVGVPLELLLTWLSNQTPAGHFVTVPFIGIALLFLASLAFLSPKLFLPPAKIKGAAALCALVACFAMLSPVMARSRYPQDATVLYEAYGASVVWRAGGKTYAVCSGDGKRLADYSLRAHNATLDALVISGRTIPGGQILGLFANHRIGALYVPQAWLNSNEHEDLLFTAQKMGIPAYAIEGAGAPVQALHVAQGKSEYQRLRIAVDACTIDFYPYADVKACTDVDMDETDILVTGFTGPRAQEALAPQCPGVFIGSAGVDLAREGYVRKDGGSFLIFTHGDGYNLLPYRNRSGS